MKYLLLMIVVLLPAALVAQGSETPSDSVDGPAITFIVNQADLGDLRQGEKAEYLFEFTNMGNKPLVIQNVISTCGCTVPQWPKEPVKPGEKSVLKVVFDSSGKIGRQNKIITIRSNVPGPDKKLRISAMVLPPE
jgi:hypothetical protein